MAMSYKTKFTDDEYFNFIQSFCVNSPTTYEINIINQIFKTINFFRMDSHKNTYSLIYKIYSGILKKNKNEKNMYLNVYTHFFITGCLGIIVKQKINKELELNVNDFWKYYSVDFSEYLKTYNEEIVLNQEIILEDFIDFLNERMDEINSSNILYTLK